MSVRGVGPVTVAMLGARLHYAVPVELHRRGLLRELYTDIFVPAPVARVGRGLGLRGVFPASPALLQRTASVPAASVRTNPVFAVAYWLALRRARTRPERLRTYLEFGDLFCAWVVRRWRSENSWLYVFSTAAAGILERARQDGVPAVVEQMSLPHGEVLECLLRAAEIFPDWGCPDPPGGWDARYAAREREEWGLATAVICPSHAVRDAVVRAGIPARRVLLVPYGVAGPAAGVCPPGTVAPMRTCRALFVGRVTLAKGAPLLYRAAVELAGLPVTFRAVGRVGLPEGAQHRLAEVVELPGPVPRSEVWREYASADLFVFPSFFEGSATVVYEALAAGLPVVTTPEAGSVVRDGIEGFVVPAGDSEAFAARIEQLVVDHELRRWMAGNAQRRAAEFTVERYGERLLAALDRIARDAS